MKKLFLLLPCLLLTACPYSIADMADLNKPLKEIRNPECDIIADGLYIIQVLDDGILGEPVDYSKTYGEVDKSSFTRRDKSETLYIPIDKKILKDKYDDSASDIGEMTCLKNDGTYSYTTAMGAKRTIRKLKLITPRVIPNPEYNESDS